MSRIDEAMRRMGAPGPRPVPAESTSATDSAYPTESSHTSEPQAPWEFETAAAPPPPLGNSEAQLAADPVVPPPGLLAESEVLTYRVQTERLVTGTSSSIPVEQYRRVAATLHHAQADRGLRVVMITSALPREGKSLTAVNVALTLSESYRRRVLLIDADLRRPSLHEIFGVANTRGLGDGLATSEEHKLPVAQVSPTLTVLTGGRPVSDPMHMLSSARMRKIVEEAAQNFDWVLIDTPPVALLPDANLLAAMVDVAILVVEAGSTQYPAVQRAIETVGRERILGVILNKVNASQTHHHYGYDSDYGYGGYGTTPAR